MKILKNKIFKNRILKKNQAIISVIALMLIAAGYLNYSSKITSEVSAEQNNEGFDYAGIGDAKLVDSENVVEGQNESLKYNTNNENEQTETTIVPNEKGNNNEETAETSANETSNNDYFTTSRLEREKMYSQMLETYQKILENPNIAEDQKAISSQEITNINNTKNAIMIAENLIKTKGFEDLVIFVNDKSVSIVVKSPKLEQNQIAQIQNIISREMNVQIEDIHISNK